ncbi:histidinol phosphate phosphatase [Clostridium sp.]|uniref:histidinol phosphate phosphatase n=1 Tax=Clostridium sp. TaxID=1506 RepID=UPI0026180727|nr:histidinol phosphate phosphatase [uncultured Clostridium sp.]
MIDSHIHTEFSDDSEMKVQYAMEQSRESGIGMIFTEHLDLNFPAGADMTFDIEKYFNDYERYRSKKLMLGIEIGMQEICLDKNRNVASKYPFDYIIGSIHAVDGEDIYYPKYYEGKAKKDAYDKYFLSMLANVEKHDFIDSLGHIDYISRYATYNDKEMHYQDYNEYINEIFKIIVQNEKVIEINTRRFGNSQAYNNLIDIYKAYSQIGGKYVTIGSDAHNVENIGAYFTQAIRLCEICNLKPVYFRERKMEYMSI